jgi:dTDP-4-amino-4,6-dideoxygalactose transaminase
MSDPFNFPQQELIRHGHLLADAAERMTRSGQLILGEGVRGFEAAFATWLAGELNPEQVIGVASGTDALELALRGADVAPGDRVLLPAHTAYATVAAVLRVEAIPVFVDIAPGRSVLCPEDLDDQLHQHAPVKAVIAVHLYGEACDLDAIAALCCLHGVSLIEDCAQACGTSWAGGSVGLVGRFAAFSFYPTKNLAAFGDGGALVVNRPEEAEAARRSRCYGWDATRQAVQFGVNSRLDELQAWILLAKLTHLDDHIRRRRQVAGWYRERLTGRVELPPDGPGWSHSYHLHVIRLEPQVRGRLLGEAARLELPLAVHYPLACHQHPYVLERFGPTRPLVHTEELLGRILTLPLHPYLEKAHIERVCRRLEPWLPERI